MVLQAYIDDSYTDNGVFVLAGYIASAQSWASFSSEWEQLLPTTFRGPSGISRFKMSEMQHYLDRVPPFYKVIEDHVLMSISCKLHIMELQRVIGRIWSDNHTIVWGPPQQPYWTAFSMLMTKFHQVRYEMQIIADRLPLDQKVDFYLDDHAGGGSTNESRLGWVHRKGSKWDTRSLWCRTQIRVR